MRLAQIGALVLFTTVFCAAQIPSGSSGRATPTKVEIADAQVSQVISRAEDHFLKGKLDLHGSRWDSARDEFDNAIDTIVESGLDIRANQRLHTFYLELIERIYREEVPVENRPTPKMREDFIRSIREHKGHLERLLPLYEKNLNAAEERLARSKGSIDRREVDASERAVADSKAKLDYLRREIAAVDRQIADTLTVQLINNELDRKATAEPDSGTVSRQTPSVGFREQKFEASPLDNLSRLELSEAERYVRRTEERRVPLNGKPPHTPKGDALLERKPRQLANGKVPIVMTWIQANLRDPYSVRFVRWSKPLRIFLSDGPYWVVFVRLRAKNILGTYVLSNYEFFIRHDKIVHTSK